MAETKSFGDRLVGAAGLAGRAIGQFQRELIAINKNVRQAFLGAWAESAKWLGGQWSRPDAQYRAVENSWFFIGAENIGQIISAAEFQVVEYEGEESEPKQIPNHPLELKIRHPNPYMGRAFLWVYSVLWYLLDGNFYWFIAVDDRGYPKEIWPLPSNQVWVMPGDGDRFIHEYIYTINGVEYHIPAEYIVHVKRPNPFDIYRGMSVLVQAMMAVDSDLAMAFYNGKFFGQDNVMPSAIINLSSGDPLNPVSQADTDRLTNDLRSSYGAMNRKTLITAAAKGVEAALLGYPNKDMEFLLGRQAEKEEILWTVGIHPGSVDKNTTEANAIVAERLTKDRVWNGPATMIAEQLTSQLVHPFYGEHLMAEFKDFRIANRAQELQELKAADDLTIDERRRKFWKEKPLPDGRGQLTEKELGTIRRTEALNPAAPDSGKGNPVSNPPLGDQGLLPTQTGVKPATTSDGKSMTIDDKLEQFIKGVVVEQDNYWRNLVVDGMVSDELKHWQDKSIKCFQAGNGGRVPFVSDVIPLEVQDYIDHALMHITTADEIKSAFSSAKSSPRPWSSREQALYSELRRELKAQADDLAREVEERGPSAINQNWIDAHRDALMIIISQALISVAQLGVTLGAEALGEFTLGISINWSLVNQNAVNWARQHAAALVRELDDTTQAALNQAVTDWTAAGGESKADLAARIRAMTDPTTGLAFSPYRARLIAQTESTNVFSGGNAMAWLAAGLPRVLLQPSVHPGDRCRLQPKRLADGSWVITWQTARDELVCTQDIDVPWGSGTVEGCRALNGVIVSEGDRLGEKV